MPESAFDRRIVSVLFADIVGFTPLSESLDPEDVATVQDAYFAATRDTITRYGGALEKFIGDAAMAVFGTPRARDDDAERAVRAGLALLGAIEQINARLGFEPATLQLRVGVNTGEVVHATAGPDAGRVTGDTVNTAARFQAAARPGSVLIGELTALSVAETIETRSVGSLDLKGKAEPLRAWEALGARSRPSREEALGVLTAPILGRDAELARLRAAGTGLTLIVAPPGVGKSRLLAELAATAEATVLRARVRPHGTAPYEAVAQLFEAAGGDLAAALADAGVPPARAAVVVEEVRRLADPSSAVPETGAGDLAGQRDARFDAWVTALDALAGGPSAWLVEDVHWADGDLLAFLEHAGKKAPSAHGRVVVATARPSLLESSPAWCASAERLDLDPLQATDAEALIRALVGDALPASLVATVIERSDGTPLFIEELLRTWVSVGTLVHDEGRWQLAVEPDEVVLPPTVQAIYAAQLDDLPPDARLLARRGTVAGRRVPVAAFAPLEVAGREGLEALRRRAFLEGPVEDAITGEEWAYRHALLRDAGYASLARAERARLHAAMGRWLAATAGDRADDVAEAVAEHHAMALEALPALGTVGTLDRATLAGDAAAWYERAADASLRLSALDAARRLLSRSIELTDDAAPLDRARRRLRLGEVLAASADLDAGIADMVAAREALAADLPASAVEYERATYALGRAYMQQIRFPEAQSVTQQGIDALGGSSTDPALARLHALHAWSLAANGQPEGVIGEADAALAAAAGGDPVRELEVLEHRTSARDEVDAASASDWEQLEARALALGRWQQAVVAARVRGVLLADADPREALPLLDSAAELAAAHGLTEQGGWCDYSRTEVLWVLGEWDDALLVGLRAVEIAERYAYERLAFRTWMVLLQIAAARGDARAVERFDRWWAGAAGHFPPNPSPYGQLLHGAVPVWRSQARQEPVSAPPDTLVEAFVPIGNPHFLGAVLTVLRAWLDRGRSDLAATGAARLVEYASDPDASVLMQASAAIADAWVSGSKAAADRAAELATTLPAPRWLPANARAPSAP